MSPDETLLFLNANLDPVVIDKIERVPYSGKIYDVTVPNHILLVRRDGEPVWSGNSYLPSKDTELPEEYHWDTNHLLNLIRTLL